MYETILAPTDGSDGAENAVERAIELATLFNADLHLLYVADSEQFSADKPEAEIETMLDDLEDEGQRIVADLEDQAYDSSVDYVETHVDRGTPHEKILEYVDTHGIELVVLGTHGESGYEAVHLGHIAHEVARRLDEPLLLI
ncbi:universal stress protein [Halobellus sp. H-GB7]|uniref:universal stress protein n=1 Tax=Halobellus sp. H-GB7 TaxID=3069756 RepID=UPI0027B45FA6|nr:universal stress protein [Halobellus sp. H-GB7]MDQ2053044.1 universal stress protein [Halobellus sp. H-GB7]